MKGNVIIIEDEPLARTILKEYLEHYPGLVLKAECSDGFEGLKSIQEHRPDLVFLDIQMPKINGFEMLELISEPPPVIFTTAFDEYAMKAFETNAVDYLLKPFTLDRFDKALRKWELRDRGGNQHSTRQLLETAAHSPAQSHRIVVKSGSRIRIIPVEEIVYLEAADDFVKIFTREGFFMKNRTMAYFENVLSADQFVRSHRSYIINIQEITRIDLYEKESYKAVLRSGAAVPVSRSGYARLKEVLGL